jgi:hypothetical protein
VHAVTTYERVDLNFHPFVNLSLHVCDFLASGRGLFYPCGKIFRYPLKKRFVGSQSGMVEVEGEGES